ncbi:unnamed protein product [Urochloa humidicola]
MHGNGDPPLPNQANPSSTPPPDSILTSAHAAQRVLATSLQSTTSGGRTPFNPPAPAVGRDGGGVSLGHGGLGDLGAGRGTLAGARPARGRGNQGGGRGGQGVGRGAQGGRQRSQQEGGGLGSQPSEEDAATLRRGKKKAVDTGDAIDWTEANTTLICNLFAKQVNKGNRPNTHLNSVGYEEVQEDFFNLTAIHLSKRQMRNKWDKLKPDYVAWKKLMRKQIGPGWDRRRGVIDMDDEWWKKAKKDIPGCGKFRKKPLQNEEDLPVMFSDIINDQSDHWNPMSSNPIIPPPDENGNVNEIPDDVDNGNVNEILDGCDDDPAGGDEMDDLQDISPSPTILLANKRIPPAKKQRTGTTLVIQEQVTKIAESASSFASIKLAEVTVEQVMEHVLECGAGYDTDEHYIATELFVKRDQRKMFMTMPTNEIRFNWLSRKYNAKYGN